MPLKHATETFLVFLLGFALLLTGLTVAFLPPLQARFLPWSLAFLVSILYPLILHPFFRNRRADYAFRLLHFLPVLLLLLWLGFSVLGPSQPSIARAERLYRFAWTLPGVILGFSALIAYCLEVMRQRRARLVLLVLLLLSFGMLGVSAESLGWNQRIASVLDAAKPITRLRQWGIASLPGAAQSGSKEQWQMQQRRMDRRSERLARDDADRLNVEGAKDATMRPIAGSAGFQTTSKPPVKPKKPAIIAKKAPKLPPSGFGTEVVIPMALAAYTGVLHMRARRRMP